MGAVMKLLISEESGFRKEYVMAKAVTRIGSAPANDLQLRSSHISPFHIQILYTRDMPDRCKVVNLSGEAIALISGGQESSLPGYVPVEVSAGDEIRLHATRLVFELPLTVGVLTTSNQISAALALPEPVLRPNTTLVGRIVLKNEGDQASCQFQVEVGGLPEDCYQVDPIPLMYAGAQEDVNIRFFHRNTYPPAGFQSVTISVTAPASYPGEQVILQQGVYVTPVLEQGLQILDDMTVPKAVVPVTEFADSVEPQDVVREPVESLPALDAQPQPESALPVETPRPQSMVEPAPVPVEPVAAAQPEPVADLIEETLSPDLHPEPVSPPRPQIPARAKVVKTPSESFWDE
jgi:hypothetical protein